MYTINNVQFKTKEEIKSYTQDLMWKNIGKPFYGDNLEFFKELIEYHDHAYKKEDVVTLEVKLVNNAPILYMAAKKMKYGRKKWDGHSLDIRAVSINICITNIPTINDAPMDELIIPFGKYRGIKLIDITDRQYLKWFTTIHKNRKQNLLIYKHIRTIKQ